MLEKLYICHVIYTYGSYLDSYEKIFKRLVAHKILIDKYEDFVELKINFGDRDVFLTLVVRDFRTWNNSFDPTSVIGCVCVYV